MARRLRTPPASPAAFGIVLLVAALIGVIGLSLLAGARRLSPEERLLAARESLAGVSISATVVGQSLAATDAIADFGITEGVRLVRVRIVDELQLDLRIATRDAVALAAPPRVCLVGPFSAPDDAGLTDRCWGTPDLAALVASQLAAGSARHLTLEADHPILLSATLRRGTVRCDYPPGEWLLEVTLDLLVDGTPVTGLDLPTVSVFVPVGPAAPLPYLRVDTTRYCGLANVVYRDQGEPLVLP